MPEHQSGASRNAAGQPLLSIVLPADGEGSRIIGVLDELFSSVRTACEVLVVVQDAADATADAVAAYAALEPRLACLVAASSEESAEAIRCGIAAARAPVIVVTTGRGDDPQLIDDLGALVRRGAAVAAASRYAPGGGAFADQCAGALLATALGRLAGRSLQVLARTGTSDAAYSFKAYSAQFARSVGIESGHACEVGIELTAKARRLRLPVAEIPASWTARRVGVRPARAAARLPGYLRWYLFSFGRPLTAGQVAEVRLRPWGRRAATAPD